MLTVTFRGPGDDIRVVVLEGKKDDPRQDAREILEWGLQLDGLMVPVHSIVAIEYDREFGGRWEVRSEST